MLKKIGEIGGEGEKSWIGVVGGGSKGGWKQGEMWERGEGIYNEECVDIENYIVVSSTRLWSWLTI